MVWLLPPFIGSPWFLNIETIIFLLKTLLCHLCYDLARIIHSFFISWWTNKMILVIAFLVFIMIISPFHISIKRLDMAQQCTKSIVHKWNFTNDLGRPSINGGCQLVHFCLTTRLLHLGILEWCHYFPSLFDISNVCEYPWKFGQAWITHIWDCKLLIFTTRCLNLDVL